MHSVGMDITDSVAEDLKLAVLGLTAAVGALTDAVLILAKTPPPSSKRKGAKS